MSGNRSLCLIILLAALASSGVAEATLVHSDSELSRGTVFTSQRDLVFVGPGAHRVSATDLHWLNSPLSVLSFGAFPAAAPFKTLIGAGTLEFFYAGHGTVHFQLYLWRVPGKFWALIGVHVTNPNVVALPASLWLLSSALAVIGIGSWIRRARFDVARGFRPRLAPAA